MLAAVDQAVFAYINSLHFPWLDTVMLTASQVGRRGMWALVIAGLLLIFSDRRAAAWRVVLTLALTALVVDGVAKPLVWRDRPFLVASDARVIATPPTSSSMPSGHAALAVAAALAVSRALPAATVWWWALAAAIGVSRVYVGVHFPFDVAMGGLLGLLCGRFTLGDVKPQHAPFAPGPVPGTG